ncbi:hypothetical protein ACIA8K_00095 [Catenuloplanes sp. NPDC051500]
MSPEAVTSAALSTPPGSSLVEVSGLIHPDLLIEIEAVVELPATS